MAYASFDDLRSSSELRKVQDADDDALATWSSIAKGEIDQFCSRDFVVEKDVTKSFWVSGPLIVLDKEVFNITAAESFTQSGVSEGPINFATEFLVVPPNNRQIRYQRLSRVSRPYPITPKLVTITADWGHDPVPEDVERVFKRLVDRIAARSHEDDVLQMHQPYVKQADGDDYEFDLANGTLRNLLRPEDRTQLWKWVHHGRVAS